MIQTARTTIPAHHRTALSTVLTLSSLAALVPLTAAAQLTAPATPSAVAVAQLPGLGEETVPGAPTTPTSRLSYVIGVSGDHVPTYSGSNAHALRPRPLWAVQFGQFRLSTSGARAVMGFGGDPVAGSGASVQLGDTGAWKLGASLRLASGRSSSDDPALAGLPDIRSTLRGRLYGERRLGDHWSAGVGLSHDLLGRGGGGIATFGLGRGGPLTPHSEWSAGIGASVANGVYMQTHYGVSAAAAARSNYPAFMARAGLLDVSAGLGATTALSPRWIAFAGAGVGQLLGDAANSPLTRSATSWRLSAGIAYRCCRH